ncbi:thiamine phosphate synthase [Brevibacillus humidisoli]|uniref:thiamine phosphate synthase n=1 Tax=Brevibacillus humidisoli TaxID=2895522 RepID=UPI001E311365|nr:thiamine phosphate synthase [Brevibacillus humidisoli]UFJ42315.1 thiamine phosphate synthase [Brevibacillus humidisoli]
MERSLHLITSGQQTLEETLRVAEAAARGGVDYLHIREKHRTARELLEWVEQLSRVFRREQLIVNDRIDVAMASSCGGAHLAYHSLPPQLARPLLPADCLLGQSVHSLSEAEQAERGGVSYVLYGHVYESGSKPGLAPRGTEELRQIAARLQIPLIAIGGITPKHVPELLAAGCGGIAVLSGITTADDPEAAARTYRQALDSPLT